jgi:hypothetical protein
MASTGSITCPKCGATSHHPMDVQNRYCGRCHNWHVLLALLECERRGIDTQSLAFMLGMSLDQFSSRISALLNGGGEEEDLVSLHGIAWDDGPGWRPRRPEDLPRGLPALEAGDRVLCLTTGPRDDVIRVGREYTVRSVHPESKILYLENNDVGAPSVPYPMKWFEKVSEPDREVPGTG